MLHGGPFPQLSFARCYIATVKQSETITPHKKFCPVRGQKRGLARLDERVPAEVDALIGAQICTNNERS